MFLAGQEPISAEGELVGQGDFAVPALAVSGMILEVEAVAVVERRSSGVHGAAGAGAGTSVTGAAELRSVS
jgi:hypothetical protein